MKTAGLTMRVLLFAALVLVAVRPAFAADPPDGVHGLRDLMTERLAAMTYVAAYKWNEGLAIEDKARETRVLNATLSRADVADAGRAQIARALQAQMAAAKRVQRRLFADWEAAGKSKSKSGAVPDLEISLRPRIGRLSNALVTALLATQDDLETCDAQQILAPVPQELSAFPEAWGLAVEGVLAAPDLCGVPQN